MVRRIKTNYWLYLTHKKLDQGENALARILDNFAVGFVLKCLLNLKRC